MCFLRPFLVLRHILFLMLYRNVSLRVWRLNGWVARPDSVALDTWCLTTCFNRSEYFEPPHTLPDYFLSRAQGILSRADPMMCNLSTALETCPKLCENQLLSVFTKSVMLLLLYARSAEAGFLFLFVESKVQLLNFRDSSIWFSSSLNVLSSEYSHR